MDSETISGRIVRVSERGAEALVEASVVPRSDLRLDLTVPGAEPTQIYAKALSSEPENGGARVRLRFTAVPESVGAALNDLAPESA